MKKDSREARVEARNGLEEKPVEIYKKQTKYSNKQKGLHTMVKGHLSQEQGWFNTWKSTNVIIHHNNRIWDKNHIIVSTNTGQAFDETHHSLMIKTLTTLGTEENFRTW